MTLTRPAFAPAAVLAAVLAAALLTGCATPRIVIHDDPLSAEEHLQLGVSYENQGELDLARAQYDKATDLPQAWFYLGNIAYRQERWEEAERHYRRAIGELPDDPRPLNNLAWMLLERGRRLDEAEALARRAVALAPFWDAAPFRDTLEAILAARAAAQTQ